MEEVKALAMQGHTLEEIGEQLGFTREWARQLLKMAGVFTVWKEIRKRQGKAWHEYLFTRGCLTCSRVFVAKHEKG